MSEHAPITGDLRDTLKRAKCTFTNSAGFEQVNVTKDALDSMLDAIDAIHANLERENERLRRELRDRPIAVGADVAKTIARLEWENAALKAERDEGLPEQVDAKVRHIPDELRAYANRVEITRPDVAENLNAIADRIETGCRTLAANQWMRGIKYAHSDDGLREYGLVSLPVDADGVSWHIGDYDEHNREVTCIRDAGHGWEIVVDGLYTCEPTSLRHHKPDTWERIIEDARMCTGSREDYTAVPSMRWTNETDALVARCKALAGDAE